MIPDNEVRLSHMAPGGGCAAKIGPGTLQGILEQLPRFSDENLLVGIETSDDGAVYRISPELALIQTLDFFPPMVDDPFLFGQIAAANALSDIYAMGGVPKVALNIVAWPNCVNPAILGKILAGGAEKVKEAGAVLAGGHSIQDDVPKYGLSVTGFVHPDQMYTNCGARPGDQLLLISSYCHHQTILRQRNLLQHPVVDRAGMAYHKFLKDLFSGLFRNLFSPPLQQGMKQTLIDGF